MKEKDGERTRRKKESIKEKRANIREIKKRGREREGKNEKVKEKKEGTRKVEIEILSNR